ncbi:hypothetical protein Ahy_A07g032930 [Arachis hypogaea]|uniref:Uncharacterized protein n=1 Tax=Arachis hypogaea TaxID=3818 RepID=A0A445C7V3_ARAHY|nr:hypothetical protein Ahy_A07g032930 [Arachis hypogaea]
MGAYNSKYQFVIHPVLSQEYWQHIDLPPILPPIYKKQIGRPKLKRDKKNDRPKESTPNLHRAPKKYGPIICKYCLKTRHNSRSCSKKNETMAGSAGEQTSSQHPSTGGATETPPVSQPVPDPVMPLSVRPPTIKKLSKKRKNLKRPPPTTQQPPCAQTIVRTPTPNVPSSVSPSPPTSHVHPLCDTSNHASCLLEHYFKVHGLYVNSRH